MTYRLNHNKLSIIPLTYKNHKKNNDLREDFISVADLFVAGETHFGQAKTTTMAAEEDLVMRERKRDRSGFKT